MSLENSVSYELDLSEPPEELLQWAKENIGEDPETRCQVISDLRDMIYSRGECTPLNSEDDFLLRFLRARYFTVPRAHRLLVNYHEFKENNPELCENVDLLKLKESGVQDVILVPPYRDETGRRLLLFKVAAWDPQKLTINQLLQAIIAIIEMAGMEERSQILGGVCIFDCGGLSTQQAWQMTPSIARKIIQIIATSFPMRTHALHIVNQSYIFDIAYNIFKPFLNEAMKERIFFHGEDRESLHKHVDPKCLPEAYGGTQTEYNNWIDSCKKNKEIVSRLKDLGYVVPEEET